MQSSSPWTPGALGRLTSKRESHASPPVRRFAKAGLRLETVSPPAQARFDKSQVSSPAQNALKQLRVPEPLEDLQAPSPRVVLPPLSCQSRSHPPLLPARPGPPDWSTQTPPSGKRVLVWGDVCPLTSEAPRDWPGLLLVTRGDDVAQHPRISGSVFAVANVSGTCPPGRVPSPSLTSAPGLRANALFCVARPRMTWRSDWAPTNTNSSS